MKYNVLVEFELEGVKQDVGSQIEVTEEVAAPLVEAKTLELVAE